MTIFAYLKDIALTLVRTYGYWGILGLGLSVAIYQPMGPDLFILGEAGLGCNPYLAAAVALVGTLAGAWIGYELGKHLGIVVLRKVFRVKEKHLAKGKQIVSRYGIWAVGIAAFSPVPLRETSWLAGTFNMRLKPYMGALVVGLIPRYFGLAALGTVLGHFLW